VANWSAQRIRNNSEFAKYFNYDNATNRDQLYFTGEMIYPFMFDCYKYLQPFKEVAELLAQYNWSPLYNIETLKQNKVPCAAIAYYHDMYVDFVLGERTAAIVGNLKLWITSEYDHHGIREDGERILNRLILMARESI